MAKLVTIQSTDDEVSDLIRRKFKLHGSKIEAIAVIKRLSEWKTSRAKCLALEASNARQIDKLIVESAELREDLERCQRSNAELKQRLGEYE